MCQFVDGRFFGKGSMGVTHAAPIGQGQTAIFGDVFYLLVWKVVVAV